MALRCARRVVVLALVLALAACGNPEPARDSESASDAVARPTLPTVPPTLPVRTLPPTWTPPPSATPAQARPTAAVTLDRPTATMVILPTLTPSPTAADEGPSDGAASGPVELELRVTADTLNEVLYTVMGGAVGGYFGDVPYLSLGSGRAQVNITLWTTPGDPSTAREIVVEFGITASGGRVRVEPWRVVAADTGTSYVSDLSDDITGEVQRQIDRLLIAGVGEGVPFSVTAVTIGEGYLIFTIESAGHVQDE